MAMQTIKVGRCPVCDSIQTEVRVDEGHLSARAKCVKCGEQGAKIKVSCKDDLPLACEMAARTFSTKIIDENDEGAPSVEDVAALLSNLLSEVCSESDCDSCIMRGGYTNRIGIGCYSRDTSDVKRALIERFPGWG
jgi:hypothetical protein